MSPSSGREDLRLFAYLEQTESTKRQLCPARQRVNRGAELADRVVSVATIFWNNPAYRAYRRKLSQQSALTAATTRLRTTSVDVVKPRATMLTMTDRPLLVASPASSDQTTPAAAVEVAVTQPQRRVEKRVRAAKENLNLGGSDMKRRKKRL